LEIIVSNVPTTVSFPLFSCAKSQNVNNSMLIILPQASIAYKLYIIYIIYGGF
jgi:hypothetical protein